MTYDPSNILSLEIIDGVQYCDDGAARTRALDAAEAVFAASGVSVADARAAYVSQWAEFDDEAPMMGSARIWIDAGRAANLALTQGWANPGGGWCVLAL
jgi:hypothetical protein